MLRRRTAAAVGAAVGGLVVAWAAINAGAALASDSTGAGAFYLAAFWAAGWLLGLLLAGACLLATWAWRRLRQRLAAEAATRP